MGTLINSVRQSSVAVLKTVDTTANVVNKAGTVITDSVDLLSNFVKQNKDKQLFEADMKAKEWKKSRLVEHANHANLIKENYTTNQLAHAKWLDDFNKQIKHESDTVKDSLSNIDTELEELLSSI